METDIQFEYLSTSDPKVNDRIMEGLPPHSMVINATGMGKDTPGSPISWDGRFPLNGVAWEFNYRGELDFLHQALAQQELRSLSVEDGWVYFLHGWTQVVAQVLHIKLDELLFAELARAAEIVRK
jgi:shikimate 5-dehydrogenase